MSEDSSSRYTEDAEEYLQDVMTFLSRAGAIGLLVEMDHTGGKQFKHLNEAISVSSSTLTNRLNEALELGILKLTMTSEEHNSSRVYATTKFGRQLHHQIKQQQLARIYMQLQQLENEFEDEVENLQQWVYTEYPSLASSRPPDPRSR